VFNGTSFTDVEELNSNKDVNVFARVVPAAADSLWGSTTIFAHGYLGTRNKIIPDGDDASDYKRNMIGLGARIDRKDVFDIGFDLNVYEEGQGPSAGTRSASAHSFFGSLYFGGLLTDAPTLRTLDLFGRVDVVDPQNGIPDNGETLMVVGLECAPTKGVKAAVNYRAVSFEDDSETERFLYLNWLISL
jgi:hypothetical protein